MRCFLRALRIYTRVRTTVESTPGGNSSFGSFLQAAGGQNGLTGIHIGRNGGSGSGSGHCVSFNSLNYFLFIELSKQ